MKKGWLVVVVFAVCFVGVFVWRAVFTCDLFVVNGLPVAVTVSAEGTTQRVAPGEHMLLGTFGAGALEIRAFDPDGREFDRQVLLLNSSERAFYNPLGAAPLRLRAIVYTQSPSPLDEPIDDIILCGSPFFSRSIDFVFTAPPRSLSMAKGEHRTTRTAIDLAEGAYERCISELAARPNQAVEFVRRLAPLFDVEERRQLEWTAATFYARAGETQKARALARRLLDEAPEDVEAHRGWQGILRLIGEQATAREQYRARFAERHDVLNAYLYARLLEPAPSLAVLSEWADGDDPWVHRSLLWNHATLGHHDDVLRETSWCSAHADQLEARMLELCVELRALALVAKGDALTAHEELTARYKNVPRLSVEQAILLERVAKRANTKPLIDTASRAATGASVIPMRRYLGLAVDPLKPGVGGEQDFDLLVLSARRPQEALALLEQRPRTASYLTNEAAMLLFGEAARTGRSTALGILSANLRNLDEPPSRVAEWVLHGGDDFDLSNLVANERTSLLLARARRLESQGDLAAAEKLYRQLTTIDPLEGLACHALRNWPGPEPTKELEGTLERSETLRLLP
ncbi:MAG: hypothetical protein ACOZQL_38940 [Myxococcota bacterium]